MLPTPKVVRPLTPVRRQGLDAERLPGALQLADPLERERRLREREHRETEQRERVVIPGAPVEIDLFATGASVHENPLASPANGDADRLHEGTALRRAVPRRDVDVTAPQTVRAMVPVGGTVRVVGHVELAVAAAERLGSSSISAASLI
jgi:hypothetical protein